jgi:hypothetical protein
MNLTNRIAALERTASPPAAVPAAAVDKCTALATLFRRVSGRLAREGRSRPAAMFAKAAVGLEADAAAGEARAATALANLRVARGSL